MSKYVVVCIAVFMAVSTGFAVVSDFESLTLAPESHWVQNTETGFTDGDIYFPHHGSDFGWSGFAYSNETDMTTNSYTNYSAYIAGAENNTSGNQYGFGFVGSDYLAGYAPIPERFDVGAVSSQPTQLSGAWITNTTYAYQTMLNGGAFGAKKYGGQTGDDPDYFKLIISGVDAQGNYTASFDFYLADFRYADNSQDYIVDQWTWVDFSQLGVVSQVEFSFESTDVGQYGINTPMYFAIDNINGSSDQAPAVPEPASLILFSLGAMGLAARKRS